MRRSNRRSATDAGEGGKKKVFHRIQEVLEAVIHDKKAPEVLRRATRNAAAHKVSVRRTAAVRTMDEEVSYSLQGL